MRCGTSEHRLSDPWRLPIVLAAHQLIEAVAWWGLQGKVPSALGHTAEWLYLAVAFGVLPILVPMAVGALDPVAHRLRAGMFVAFPALDYDRHLFQERTVRSVTANTRADGAELLRLAPHIPLDIRVTAYAFDSVGRALADLAADRVTGSAVVTL